jgi:D-3-phosphoglycerate dehydrogenase
MLVVHNNDTPGRIGLVGMILGEAGVNIEDMDVGRAQVGERAVMVIAIDRALDAVVLDELRAAPGIVSVTALDLA